MFETFLGQRICSYFGELEILEQVGQGGKHKPNKDQFEDKARRMQQY